MKNKIFQIKKGLSTVISTLLIVLLVLGVTAILWSVSTGLINGQIKNSEKCSNILGQINFNSADTCYNSQLKKLEVSISTKDIEVGGMIITVGNSASSKSVSIPNSDSNLIHDYSSINTLTPLGKNEGRTYVISLTNLIVGDPTFVKVAPIMGGVQCDVVDTLNGINVCIPSSQ